ncbi:MAG: DUF4159 domain-containing protein [Pseudomonadota bacterium]
MSIGALAFLSPWLLTGLAALPLIYWLLRTVPPRPQQINFPPTRILVGIENREKTPATTPWWLLLLRLLAAALVIFALAQPILNPNRDQPIAGEGPLVIVIDNGWASAPRWSERVTMAERMIDQAERSSRPIMLLPTAAAAKSPTVRLESPTDARTTLGAVIPQPFAPERSASLSLLNSAFGAQAPDGTAVVWLTDGIAHDDDKDTEFTSTLSKIATSGSFVVISDDGNQSALGLTAEVESTGKLSAQVYSTGDAARSGILQAYSAKDEQLGEVAFALDKGETKTTTTFELPLELRNQITRIAISGNTSAGAVHLLDARDQWQRVALLSGERAEQAQPLLGPLHYIEKALVPFAEIVKPKGANLAAGIEEALSRNAGIIMMADIGTLRGAVADDVRNWVSKGGILVRFSGPRLEKGGDDLLPAALRVGGRTLGGALSWSKPQPLAAFPDNSPFAGLKVAPDVRINRQVLADPTQLTGQTAVWANLEDGTPLVTAKQLGDGQLVLFHVTANSDWSNLPLSGLFVDMLRRVSAMARIGGGGATDEGASTNNATNQDAEGSAEAGTSNTSSASLTNLPPTQTLDGFGAIRPPPPTARAMTLAQLDNAKPSLDHPPGYYGPGGSPRALNVMRAGQTLKPLAAPSGAETRGFVQEDATRLKPWLLAAALALLLIDVIAVLLLQSGGRLFSSGRASRSATASIALAGLLTATTMALLVPASTSANAQPAPANATSAASKPLDPEQAANAALATSKVTLGYVVTGDDDIDQISRVGLTGLCRILTLRTAVTPGDPMAVNINDDVIAFYPVLYWPVLDDAKPLSEETVAKIDAYMKQGGMIIFDTRDHGLGTPSSLGLGVGETPLQRILARLDIPRLEPVPEGHVLTKSFYLLRAFPGRWDGGQLWVEAGAVEAQDNPNRQARQADGVSSILITSNDFASAWAIDERGRPFYPTVPGGERQREMAFRTGINIVMHALTGNYKADQVHVPALLERLGQ